MLLPNSEAALRRDIDIFSFSKIKRHLPCVSLIASLTEFRIEIGIFNWYIIYRFELETWRQILD